MDFLKLPLGPPHFAQYAVKQDPHSALKRTKGFIMGNFAGTKSNPSLGWGIPILALALSHQARAWDAAGHQMIALYADQELTPAARAAVERLLAPGETMASVSTWADQVKVTPEFKYTYGFHFSDATSLESNYYTVPVNPSGDVVQALCHYEDSLRGHAPESIKSEALKFFIHFVGDIHQPLHVAVHADRGGNLIPVGWFGQATSDGGQYKMELHEIWDGQMINRFGQMFVDPKSGTQAADWQSRYVSYLKYAFSDAVLAVSEFEEKTYIDWALESHALNQLAYDRGDGVYLQPTPDGSIAANLGEAYYIRNRQVLNLRLAQAGHRLASKLNEIFSSGGPISLQEQGMRDFIKIGCAGSCVINERLVP